ncbi:sugar transferase [Parvimonas micra]|uniref:sugar transferase n=1 Tax=Parvimonas micra TaxID=33033 RepID=UPI003AFF6124
MTGLSQVSGRSSCSLEEQQHLDGYYVRNWSLWLDLHILARTVLAVVRGRGAW